MKELSEIVEPLFVVKYIQMHGHMEQDEGIFSICNFNSIIDIIKENIYMINLDDVIDYHNDNVEDEDDFISGNSIDEIIHDAESFENKGLANSLLYSLNLESQPLINYLRTKKSND